MAFSSPSSSSIAASPNVTPLIDVLLVLLIIFMVIVPVSPHGLASVLSETSRTIADPRVPDALILEVRAPTKVGSPVTYSLAGRDVDLPTLHVLLQQEQVRSARRTVIIGEINVSTMELSWQR